MVVAGRVRRKVEIISAAVKLYLQAHDVRIIMIIANLSAYQVPDTLPSTFLSSA